MNTSELIYDWNQNHPPGLKPPGPVLLNDESLRDGLQSPSVRDPSIPEKIEILHLMEALGIDSLDLGLPGAGPRAVEHVTALAREIVSHKMKIRANCAARTHENDIRPIAEIVQKTGLRIEAATFIGSSPIRRFTEGWSDDFLLRTTEKAVKYTVSLGLDSMYVTEDTSRCDPETVKRLYAAAINCGARAIVICDTAGHATPMGGLALVRFVIEEVVKPSGEKIRVDWHGHSDRGLGIANSMAAVIAGAHCVHGCAIGLGERVGNTQIDQMLVNLKLMGIAPWDRQDLTKLKHYCQAVSRATPTLMWSKLVFLAPFALTTTAADKTTGEVISDPSWKSQLEACVREACAVAVAEAARVDPEAILASMMGMPANMRSSMQKDVEQHRTPELEAIAGPILRGARRHGIEVPATKRLVAAVEQRAGYVESRLA